VAWSEGPGIVTEQDIETTGINGTNGWKVDGRKELVIDGGISNLSFLVVTAMTDKGPTLFVVDADSPGVNRVSQPSIDQTRNLATVKFDEASAQPVGAPGTATGPIARSFDRACVALASEAVGVADAA